MDAVFKALADATRRHMLDELAERPEQTFYELCARLIMKHKISMSRQAMAKHLATLERAGLVRSKRRGRYKVLALDAGPIREISKRWLPHVMKE